MWLGCSTVCLLSLPPPPPPPSLCLSLWLTWMTHQPAGNGSIFVMQSRFMLSNNDNNAHIERRNSRFFTFSSLLHKLSPTYAAVAKVQSFANHMQHIQRSFHWLEQLTNEGEEETGIRRKPLTMSFRKCHILKPKNSSLTKTQSHILALVAG